MSIHHKIAISVIFASYSHTPFNTVLCYEEPSFQSVASARVQRNSSQNYADGGPSQRNKTVPNKVPAVRSSVFPGRCLRPDPRHEYPHREIITRLGMHRKSSTVVANAVASAIQHRITFIRPLNANT